MQHTRQAKLNLAVLVTAGIVGVLSSAGCSHNPAAATNPSDIKAAMGGHYTPEMTAQGRAYQQGDSQKQAQMLQNRSAGTPAKTSNP